MPQILREFDRLVDDPLFLFGITQLDIAGQRKILAERMPFEAVIGEDAAQIGIACEYDAEHVENFALKPSGDRPQRGDGRHRRILVGRNFEHDPVVLRQAEQHVDHFEPLVARRVIGPRDFDQLLIFVRVAKQA